MEKYRTGGEVDAVCTRCRMVLAHTILAVMGGRPARVQCNTCGGQHNFRSAADSEPAPRRTERAAPRAAPATRTPSFDEAIAAHPGEARPYAPGQAYALDEIVAHPVFGRGWVSAVRPGKVDVTFRGGVRTLVAGRR